MLAAKELELAGTHTGLCNILNTFNFNTIGLQSQLLKTESNHGEWC